MVFSSNVFLFGFLPCVLMGYIGFAYFARRFRFIFLSMASLAFYGWWDPRYVLLILFSVATNYAIHVRLSEKPGRQTLAAGIVLNLALLIYFKYLTFAAFQIKSLFDLDYAVPLIILPIGISFFPSNRLRFWSIRIRAKLAVRPSGLTCCSSLFSPS